MFIHNGSTTINLNMVRAFFVCEKTVYFEFSERVAYSIVFETEADAERVYFEISNAFGMINGILYTIPGSCVSASWRSEEI